MRPTVYVPLAEIRRTGLRRAGATMAARFIAGRIATLPVPPETEEPKVGANGDRIQTVLDPAERRGVAA